MLCLLRRKMGATVQWREMGLICVHGIQKGVAAAWLFVSLPSRMDQKGWGLVLLDESQKKACKVCAV